MKNQKIHTHFSIENVDKNWIYSECRRNGTQFLFICVHTFMCVYVCVADEHTKATLGFSKIEVSEYCVKNFFFQN